MSKSTKSKKVGEEKARKYTPVVVYMWAFGLGLLGYLFIGEIFLRSRQHPLHWIAGLVGGVIGYFVGWLWYRWRGDVI